VKTSEGPARDEQSCVRSCVFVFQEFLFVAKLAIHPYEENMEEERKNGDHP
jgi:hypothetical protein